MNKGDIINIDRLMSRIFRMAKIGESPNGGVNRLTLTDEDREARDLFAKWSGELGMEVKIDQMGNQFAIKKGTDPELPAVMVSSHLDSQPLGGKYDGALGVLGGLEVVERIIEDEINHKHNIEIVNWTNEEGSRFTPATLGSGFFAGEFDLEYAWSRTDSNGKKVGSELERIGYKGKELSKRNYKACLEIHIEQGPVLEADGIPVGVVSGIQGIRWYKVIIHGSEIHAGPTPMLRRNDPVRSLYPVLTEIYRMASEYAPECRATVGSIVTKPGSINTVPGIIEFTVDIRHPDFDVLDELGNRLNNFCKKQSGTEKPDIELSNLWYSPPVFFHDICIHAISEASDALRIPSKKIISGAGHDSIYLAKIAPTGMIFIPCKDGISHNEQEFASPQDIEAGVSVLYESVKRLI